MACYKASGRLYELGQSFTQVVTVNFVILHLVKAVLYAVVYNYTYCFEFIKFINYD